MLFIGDPKKKLVSVMKEGEGIKIQHSLF